MFALQHFVFKRLWQNSFHAIPQQTKKCKLVQWSNCLMATWRCCEKIDLQPSWQPWKITIATGKQNKLGKIARGEMPKNSPEYLYLLFLWNSKAKSTANLRIFYVSAFQFLPFPTSVSLSLGHALLTNWSCWDFSTCYLALHKLLQQLLFFQWHRNHNQNSELKAVEGVFLPWKVCLSGAIRNCWEGKSLALHVPNSLLQCHFHEQKDLPKKL